jgi:hypothetical protein
MIYKLKDERDICGDENDKRNKTWKKKNQIMSGRHEIQEANTNFWGFIFIRKKCNHDTPILYLYYDTILYQSQLFRHFRQT